MLTEEKRFLSEISSLISEIQQEFVGLSHSEFTTNRRLVIKIVNMIEDMIIYTETSDVIPTSVSLQSFREFNNNVITNEMGVNEERLWEFCKHVLPPIDKKIREEIKK